MVESFVKVFASLLKDTLPDSKTSLSENSVGFADMSRIWISGANNDRADSGGDDCVGARRGAPVSAARFKGDAKRCLFCVLPVFFRVSYCFDFRVEVTGAMMPPAANDLAAFDQDGADHWIGRGSSITSLGQSQGRPHVIGVTGHQTGRILLFEIKLFEIPRYAIGSEYGRPNVGEIRADRSTREGRHGIDHWQLLGQNGLHFIESFLALGKFKSAHLNVHERIDACLPIGRRDFLERKPLVQLFARTKDVNLGSRIGSASAQSHQRAFIIEGAIDFAPEDLERHRQIHQFDADFFQVLLNHHCGPFPEHVTEIRNEEDFERVPIRVAQHPVGIGLLHTNFRQQCAGPFGIEIVSRHVWVVPFLILG